MGDPCSERGYILLWNLVLLDSSLDALNGSSRSNCVRGFIEWIDNKWALLGDLAILKCCRCLVNGECMPNVQAAFSSVQGLTQTSAHLSMGRRTSCNMSVTDDVNTKMLKIFQATVNLKGRSLRVNSKELRSEWNALSHKQQEQFRSIAMLGFDREAPKTPSTNARIISIVAMLVPALVPALVLFCTLLCKLHKRLQE